MNFKAFSNIHNEEELKQYYKFGNETFGPFLLYFTKWLLAKFQINKLEKIYFLSRDGYLMKNSCEIFDDDNTNNYNYLYVSRNSLRLSLIWKCKSYKDSLKYLSISRLISISEILDYYGFSSKRKEEIARENDLLLNKTLLFNDIYKDKDIENIFNRYINEINSLSRHQFDLIKNYLIQLKIEGNCGLVDIGWHGSMQWYLERICELAGIKVFFYGFYVGVTPRESLIGISQGYVFEPGRLSLRKGMMAFFGVQEKLFQSLEGTTVRYISNGNKVEPVLASYEYVNDEDSINKISAIQNGALSYVANNIKYKKNNDTEETMAIQNFIEFGKNPTSHQIQLFDFLYNIDGIKMFYTSRKPLYKYSIKEFLISFSNSPWKTGFMKSVFKVPLPYYYIYSFLKK